jgi:hypothetical protein
MSQRALALLAIPLVLGTLWAVYQPDIGQRVLWVSAPLGALLAWAVSSTDDRRLAAEMEAWRKASGKRKPRVVFESYRNPAVVRPTDRRDLARKQLEGGAGQASSAARGKQVVAPPWELSSMVRLAGAGRQVGVYQLLPKLAYVVAVEADALATSDFVAVVARLEAKHPELVVRPRAVEERPTARTVQLKDARFNDRFFVESPAPKAAKELLSEGVRETLRDLEVGWFFVRGDAMALVRYGRIGAEDVRALVDAADEIFAEIGAEGGPSLLGDDDLAAEVPAKASSSSKKGGPEVAPA